MANTCVLTTRHSPSLVFLSSLVEVSLSIRVGCILILQSPHKPWKPTLMSSELLLSDVLTAPLAMAAPGSIHDANDGPSCVPSRKYINANFSPSRHWSSHIHDMGKEIYGLISLTSTLSLDNAVEASSMVPILVHMVIYL